MKRFQLNNKQRKFLDYIIFSKDCVMRKEELVIVHRILRFGEYYPLDKETLNSLRYMFIDLYVEDKILDI